MLYEVITLILWQFSCFTSLAGVKISEYGHVNVFPDNVYKYQVGNLNVKDVHFPFIEVCRSRNNFV